MYYQLMKWLGQTASAPLLYRRFSGHLPTPLRRLASDAATVATIAASGLFDAHYYRQSHPDVTGDDMALIRHYVRRGAYAGYNPHPLFDSAYYLRQNYDVQKRRQNPLFHFCRFGAAEGRKPHPRFDTLYYLSANADVRQGKINPLHHFLASGAREGRRPNQTFDPLHYISAYPDVADSGLNPLVHYVLYGAELGYHTMPGVAATASDEVGAGAFNRVQRASRQKTWGDWRPMQRRLAAARTLKRDSATPPVPSIEKVPADKAAQVARTLRVPSSDAPLVSIIIPVYGQLTYALEALQSIARYDTGIPCEVIVIDDCSPEGNVSLLSSVAGVRYVRNDTNLGFLRSCNKAAGLARGRYILLFNSDAQATAGWLSPLFDALESDETAGAVGPKILFPNGRLQEAGGRIKGDFTTQLTGWWDDPAAPRYSYRRTVDYCSGACLMVRADLWRQLGGFDDNLAPAYCEDVDLCLSVRAAGYRVLYEPDATIIHHFSVTSEAVASSFKVQLSQRNQQKLAQKWQRRAADLDKVRLLAFYLPQYHPIPVNDHHWGKNFTEWTGVTRARPNFAGQDQPRVPTDMGYYDLRLPQVMQQQFDLAERYGVHGFCYYYYWFGGAAPLETPLKNMLAMERVLPFCLCWANENWTRKWDGDDQEVIYEEVYTPESDTALITAWLPYMKRAEYIRVDGRPLVILYRMTLLPDVKKTLAQWRQICRDAGLGEIYIAMVESFDQLKPGQKPQDFGFDASIEFPPHQMGVPMPTPQPVYNPDFDGRVHDYRATAERYATKTLPDYTQLRGVMVDWDNTARRQNNGHIFLGSTPGAYQAWLESTIADTLDQRQGDERIVFINAWNEWAEGTYLEPDERYGHAYLEATRNAQMPSLFAADDNVDDDDVQNAQLRDVR